jgi:hypothetical protein
MTLPHSLQAPDWLASAETTLAALEKLDAADTTPAGFAAVQMATSQLEWLTKQLRGLPPAERQALRPTIARLQQRIATTLQVVGNATHNLPRQLQSLNHHGRALNAYLTANAKK